MPLSAGPVILRGGGDLGSGVVVALRRAGYAVVVVDRPLPTALRLKAAFASAAVEGAVEVGGVRGELAETPADVVRLLAAGQVPVWLGGEAELRAHVEPSAVVDARLRGLSDPALSTEHAPVVIALGPGYEARRHCHYVIETNRGPALGRVLGDGCAERHTGVPGALLGYTNERVVRSPADGPVERVCAPGDFVEAGEVIARVGGLPAKTHIDGMVRGLKLSGVQVARGQKIGDVDPRRDRRLLTEPSDKAEKVGAGVVAALQMARDSGLIA